MDVVKSPTFVFNFYVFPVTCRNRDIPSDVSCVVCLFLTLSCLSMQVTCLACDHRSNTVEPFWDLSLEFPERYHNNSRESAAQASCHLTEMLAKFTETEALEGNIYACDQCNCEWDEPHSFFFFYFKLKIFTVFTYKTCWKKRGYKLNDN